MVCLSSDSCILIPFNLTVGKNSFIWFWIISFNCSISIDYSNNKFFKPTPKLGKFTLSPG